MPQKSQWEQYCGLLRKIKEADQRKRRAKLEQNARGLAGKLMQNYDCDIAGYPTVQPTKFRDPC